ncbi:unnamed protein product [Lepeophtheirus salmonis]|uniref:(salmon louse) hypothetical protein n=1 Tax=Lepeophtheirus salmonis TaxID=72036 RepID=A0A7R8CL44_LEPSM|nr:unnamed protein product [Lepeophtheirus salmonis]CAF2852383.1 unnamed protein product [Lepeophtheirus salmonis]
MDRTFEYEKVLKKQNRNVYHPEKKKTVITFLLLLILIPFQRNRFGASGEGMLVPHDGPNGDSITPSKNHLRCLMRRRTVQKQRQCLTRGPQIEITQRDVPLSVNMPIKSLTQQSDGVLSDEICKRRSRVSPKKPNKSHIDLSKVLEHRISSLAMSKINKLYMGNSPIRSGK